MAAVTSRRPSMTAASERSSLRSNDSAHTPRPPSCATNGAPRSVVSLSELSAMPHAVQLHDGTPEEMVVLDPVDDDRFTRKLERRTSVVVRADHSATGCARCVVHPHSDLRLAWDLVSALFLLYNMVVVPFRLCFDSFSECPQAAWLFEAVVDWFFVADVVLNFRTGIFLHGDSGAVSTSCREIATKYARTWLSIDVASSVPLDFIVSLSFNGCGGGGTNTSGEEFDALKLLRGLRLAKLLKLLRLLRLSRLLDQLQDHVPINTIVSKALTMLMFTWFTAHLTACVWYMVGIHNVSSGQPSWLDSSGLIDTWNGTVPEELLPELYVASLYWAFTTMTTVGYGDLTPRGVLEHSLAIVAMMLGASVFGYIVGSATALIANADASSAQLARKMDMLNQYMSDRSLPRSLQVAIRKYFRYFWSRKTVFADEEAILGDLSSQLRGALLRFMNKDIINQMPIFEVCNDPGFLDIIVRAMRPLFCSPQDIIVDEGKMGHEMFFLLRGRVEVLHAGSRSADQPVIKVCELAEGDYFGEVALLDHTLPGLNPNRRVATVRATAWCELQSVGKPHVKKCFEEFPEVQDHIMELVRSRIARLRKMNDFEGFSTVSGGVRSVDSNSRSGGRSGKATPLFRSPTMSKELPENLCAAIATAQKLHDAGPGEGYSEEDEGFEGKRASEEPGLQPFRVKSSAIESVGSLRRSTAVSRQDDYDEAAIEMASVEAMLRELEEHEEVHGYTRTQGSKLQGGQSALPGLRMALNSLKVAVQEVYNQQIGDVRVDMRRRYSAGSTATGGIGAMPNDAIGHHASPASRRGSLTRPIGMPVPIGLRNYVASTSNSMKV